MDGQLQTVVAKGVERAKAKGAAAGARVARGQTKRRLHADAGLKRRRINQVGAGLRSPAAEVIRVAEQ